MLIKNGFLIDPATKKSGNYDIRIKNGIITEIGNTLSPAPNEQVTDAAGLTVAPGLIDTHIHFRDPGFTYKENIHTFTGRRRGDLLLYLYGKYVSGRRQYRNFNRYFRKSERRKNTRLSCRIPSLINCAAKK